MLGDRTVLCDRETDEMQAEAESIREGQRDAPAPSRSGCDPPNP
eukprot:COSAG06_NODE_19772_length_823_cov_0.765193_1_plen_43_part_01